MALKIRLRRMGRKKAPHYRIVVAESTMPRDGRFVATVGHYNPTTQPETLKVDTAKAAAWIAKGAVPTDTVRSLFRKAGVGQGGAGVVETVTEAVSAAASSAGKAAKGVAGKVAEVASSAASAVAGAATTAASAVADAAGAAVEAVKDAAESVTGGGDEAPAADAAATETPAADAATETPAADATEAPAADATAEAPAAEGDAQQA